MFKSTLTLYPNNNRTKALASTLSYLLDIPLHKIDSLILGNMESDTTKTPIFTDTTFKQTLNKITSTYKKQITVDDITANNQTLSTATKTYNSGNYFIVLENCFYAILTNGKLLANNQITSNLNLKINKIYKITLK